MAFVDVHTHAMPMPMLEWLADEGLADLTQVGSQVVRIDPRVSGVAEGAPLPLAPAQLDARTRLREMDAIGVDAHVVSLPPFLLASLTDDVGLAREVARRGNAALIDFCAADSERLIPLASVPVGTPDVAGAAAQALDTGFRGLAIGTRGLGRDLDDPVNEDLWALAADRSILVFLHPSAIPDPARLRDFWMPQLVGYPMETAVAVSRLIFSGVRARHSFPLVLAHGGGCLPTIRGRLDLGWERKEVARTTERRPSDYVGEMYFDSAVFSAEVLGDLISAFGADRILAGSDYPFELCDRDLGATISAQRLSADDAARVAGGNAQRLLGLTGGVP